MADESAVALDERFVAALLGEDELGVVIRSHAFVETQLNQFIEARLEDPSFLEELDLNYARKVDLACALGFDARYRAVLKRLGKIRNDFAHDLKASLSSQKVADLHTSLPAPGRKAVSYSHEATKAKLSGAAQSRFARLGPREKFILITLSLERLLFAARLLVRRRPRRNATAQKVSPDQAISLLPPGP